MKGSAGLCRMDQKQADSSGKPGEARCVGIVPYLQRIAADDVEAILVLTAR